MQIYIECTNQYESNVQLKVLTKCYIINNSRPQIRAARHQRGKRPRNKMC